MIFKRRKKRVTILKKQAMVLIREVNKKRNKSQAKKQAMKAMMPVTMMKSSPIVTKATITTILGASLPFDTSCT